MRSPDPLPELDRTEVAQRVAELTAEGVRVLAGSVVDMGGVARAKTVPLRRAAAFHRVGMGASPTWAVFCVDGAIAFTEHHGVVGDLRLRADLAAARPIGDGYAWAPADVCDQGGAPAPVCGRARLRAVCAAAGAAGLTARVGHELEFVLTGTEGRALPERDWQPYGLGPAVRGPFLAGLTDALERAGVPVEQAHAEYGTGQFEVSLSPAQPLQAADDAVLARLVTGRVAGAHGLRVSFSPLPFAGGAGNGAHLHLSLARDGVPLLSGGDGPHGLTAAGGAAIGGIVAGLPGALGVLGGSLLSPARLRPGSWAGAFACWGLENREAAVRLLAATRGNPHGANVEVKCGDPAANAYLATAVVLGLALDGVRRSAPLPPEVTVDPAAGPDAARLRLPATQGAVLDTLAASPVLADLLGENILAATLTVRGHERDTYGEWTTRALAERFRFAWSW